MVLFQAATFEFPFSKKTSDMIMKKTSDMIMYSSNVSVTYSTFIQCIYIILSKIIRALGLRDLV